MQDRLYLSVATGPYNEFLRGTKRFEFRAYGTNGFREKYIFEGRRVEITRAWNRERTWGTIGQVVVGSVDDIFSEIDYKLIEPSANNVEEAIEKALESLRNKTGRYIAFEIILDSIL